MILYYEEPQETFEEYVEKSGGKAEVFADTAMRSDRATQKLVCDWFFDYRLGQEPEKFTRYFKREVNDLYPRYLDMVRISSVGSNMDPYITEYMEKIGDRTGIQTGEQSGSKTSSGTGSETTTYGRTTDETHSDSNTRTDNLTETTSGSVKDTGTQKTSGSGTSDETRTDDLEETTSGSESKDGTEKNRSVSEAYPEADLGSVSVEPADTIPTAYASSAVTGQKHTEETGSNSGKRTNTGTQETSGSTSSDETRTDDLLSSSQGTRGNTGTQKTDGSGTRSTKEGGSDGRESKNSDTEETTGKTSGSTSETTKDQAQGRHESVADILPRAMEALERTDAFRWFVTGLSVCFDPFS